MADEVLEGGIGGCGGIEFAGALFEVGDEFGGVIDVWDGAAGGAGDAADESLVAALSEHAACFRVVGVNDDAIWDIAAEAGVGVGGGIEDFGIDAADSSFGITRLDAVVAILSDAHAAHGEESGGGLGMGEAEATLSGAAAEGLFYLPTLAGDDVHALGGGVDDVEPGGVVVWMACAALGGDGVFNSDPVVAKEAARF